MAGINATLKLRGRNPFVLSRTEAYIGVLIDDLITKGVDEPYRMFTSRAEYRILLRQDNADFRLTPLGHDIGLASDESLRRVEQKYSMVDSLCHSLEHLTVTPSEVNEYLSEHQSASLHQKTNLYSLLLRPELNMDDIVSMSADFALQLDTLPRTLKTEVASSAEISIKYSRYIEKEREVAERILKYEHLVLPDDMDYAALHALSFEAREKLSRLRPKTIGQASRISGVSPADISVLLIFLNSR